MLRVEVRLYGSLRRYRPAADAGAAHQPFMADVASGATVDLLSEALGIPEGFVSAAAVNGEAVESSAVLNDGDKISFFPPSAGGSTFLPPAGR